ncbi:MAG: hypothetical protein PHH26_05195, partial [Candidatus Thermoplasmatota archaeon]|nr:hypothetical protein [Candidatus Thermoplasmatota archaeon]
MLGRFELLISILVPWIATGAAYGLSRRRSANKLPPGSIVVETPEPKLSRKAPGVWWSRAGVNFGHMLNDLTLMLVVVLCIFDAWKDVPNFLVIPLPYWLNWLGMFGVWLLFAWEAAIAMYNVNFSPNYKSMTARYVLATGGPYRIVRHPTYIHYAAMAIFVFLATGIWVPLIGSIGWIALP